MWRFCLAILALPVLAAAEVCPPADMQVERQAELIDALRAAESEAEARPFNDALWQIWLTAPDRHAQDLLDSGMARREMYDFEAAERVFAELIAYCPDYAEGWNQRAFARFLRGDFEAALGDLDAALDRSPAHIGALSGKALTLMQLGQEAEAQAVLRDALALHPWLGERHLLQEPPGDEL